MMYLRYRQCNKVNCGREVAKDQVSWPCSIPTQETSLADSHQHGSSCIICDETFLVDRNDVCTYPARNSTLIYAVWCLATPPYVRSSQVWHLTGKKRPLQWVHVPAFTEMSQDMSCQHESDESIWFKDGKKDGDHRSSRKSVRNKGT
jgi:hypothetical protein